jgi:endonuclease/exonuclease/phosphatase family metal-dependent hydrolase
MLRIASYNVENLFARPKAMNGRTWEDGKPILEKYEKVNELFAVEVYTPAVKTQIRDLLAQLDIYRANAHGAIRRNQTDDPKWAWLRKNRGSFDREPTDETKNLEIVAAGRRDWIGWVELAKEQVDETATRMTARVIKDIGADIIGFVEAEDRPSLVRFNHQLMGDLYKHIMLVDGNDERGIDVGIMTKAAFEIASIKSNVDATDSDGLIISRDCPQYEIKSHTGAAVHVLVNHFKSQSGGGGPRRKRQATRVRKIAEELANAGKNVIVLGDLNEGPRSEGTVAENLKPLFLDNSPLVDCYSLPNFDLGNKPGTFDSCGLRNRFDYVLISESLRQAFRGGGIFRKGLWGSRTTRPTDWQTYPEMTSFTEQASDHAAIYIDLDL